MNAIAPSIAERLSAHGQSHLLWFWDELNETQQQNLIKQIEKIDFELLDRLVDHSEHQNKWADLAFRAEPPPAFRLGHETAMDIHRDLAIERGRQALAEGKVGMVLVAGGQGTRLGFDHPKGMFPIGPVSNRTLFQWLLDKINAVGQRYGSCVPLCIMTSPATHDETVAFLSEHQWFGYPQDHVQVFCQGTMPALDAETKKLLLSSKCELFASPDGHGGMLAALNREGCLADLQQRGIEQVFYCQIDNPLVQVCDAMTIGWHLLCESEMSLQAVAKTKPLQRVGNVVSIDGKVQIIEYSDLPDEVALQTNDDGSMRLWAGSIAVHIFDLAFLNRMTDHADALPFHLARKSVSYVDDGGNVVQPREPNAIKFERFIFDLLPMAKKSFVVEVDPAHAFAPVKNAAGQASETAATSRQALIELAKRQLLDVGVSVAEEIAVEIHPSLANHPETLKQKTAGVSEITEATYLY